MALRFRYAVFGTDADYAATRSISYLKNLSSLSLSHNALADLPPVRVMECVSSCLCMYWQAAMMLEWFCLVASTDASIFVPNQALA
eukprot:1115362-Rhodomonas_salina.2